MPVNAGLLRSRLGVQPDGPFFQPALPDPTDNDPGDARAHIFRRLVYNFTPAPPAQIRQVQIFLDARPMGVVPDNDNIPRLNTGIGCPDPPDAR